MGITVLRRVLRTLVANKLSFFVNLIGLSIGIATFLILLIWVRKERSYNEFSEDRNVYELLTNYTVNGEINSVRATSLPLIKSIGSHIPGVEAMAYTRGLDESTIRAGEKDSRASGKYASADFFRILPRPFLYGSSQGALSDPSSVVISSRLAEKLYGHDWQDKVSSGVVTIGGLDRRKIAGVFEAFPENSTLQSDFFVALMPEPDSNENVGNYNYDTYLKLAANADPARIGREVNRQTGRLSKATLTLQNFRDIYLYSHFSNGVADGGRITYVRLFVIAAVFVLLMACINFMNLHMASSFRMAKQIGIKRLMGAERPLLVRQFLAEAYYMVALSILVALVLLYLLIPVLNDYLSENLSFPLQSGYFWLLIAGLLLLTAPVASLYPAISLTTFNPVHILRMKNDMRVGGLGVRKGLFTLQFFISAFLIYGAFTANRQVQYIRHKDLGYNKQNILCRKLSVKEVNSMALLKSDLQSNTLFSSVTFSSSNLMAGGPMTSDVNWPGKPSGDSTRFAILFTDRDFIRTLKVPMERGDFGDSTSSVISVIINKRAAQLMGGERAVLNKVIDVWGEKGRVTGITRDFNFNSLFNPMEPLLIADLSSQAEYLFARPMPGRENDAVARLAQLNKKYNAENLFDYYWIEDRLDAIYKDEANVGRLSGLFCVVSVIIALSGLFGLASFTIRQRMRELCIRKILGDNVPHIVYLVFKDLIKWVLVAAVIAIPVSYVLLYNWLKKFSYRIDLTVSSFILPVLGMSVLIAFIVLYYSARIGRINPVIVLRED